jgi:hypothetical protein
MWMHADALACRREQLFAAARITDRSEVEHPLEVGLGVAHVDVFAGAVGERVVPVVLLDVERAVGVDRVHVGDVTDPVNVVDGDGADLRGLVDRDADAAGGVVPGAGVAPGGSAVGVAEAGDAEPAGDPVGREGGAVVLGEPAGTAVVVVGRGL